MIIKEEIDSLNQFKAWSGGKDTLNDLTPSQRDQLMPYLEDMFPEGCTDTELNDFLWFERDTIYEWLNLDDEGNPIGSYEWAERVIDRYYEDHKHLQFDVTRDMVEEYLADYDDEGDHEDEDNLTDDFEDFCFREWKTEMCTCSREFGEFNEMDFDDWMDDYFTASDIQPYESFCEYAEQWVNDHQKEIEDVKEDE